MRDLLQDFAFHIYLTKKQADHAIQVDSSYRYLIQNSFSIKERPDFTSLRKKNV